MKQNIILNILVLVTNLIFAQNPIMELYNNRIVVSNKESKNLKFDIQKITTENDALKEKIKTLNLLSLIKN